jgi:threonine aldolase
MDPGQVEQAIRKDPDDIHSPRTALICLENADSDGYVLDLGYMRQIGGIARHYRIPVHLDGARIFNAATALNVAAAKLSEQADTVQICLSKGLCAPVGSLLAGSSEVIRLARRKRKILGGGMRQAGILAAAGLIALREMTGRLGEDHRKARWLADQLQARGECFELLRQPEINMVFFRLKKYPLSADELVQHLAARQILVNGPDEGIFRFVTHFWTDLEDLAQVVSCLDSLARQP